MKTLEIFCDWDEGVASIAVVRTPQGGGYSKREYKRGRFVPSSNRVLGLLNETDKIYHERYLPGGGFAYSIREEADYHQGYFVNACSRCAVFTMGRACLAFDEIPKAIWQGENDHTKPFKGDHGVQFTPLPEIGKGKEKEDART